MKICPICKAEIEDNAHFCLYCMSVLEEKQTVNTENKSKRHKQLIIILIAVLALLLIVGGVLLAIKSGVNPGGTDSATSDESNQASSFSVTEEATSAENPESNAPAINNSTEEKDTGTPSENETLQISDKTEAPKSNSTTPTALTSQADIPDKAEENAVTYSYRQAKYGDDFSTSYPIDSNDIVITGVTGTSATGEYYIPSDIDGKTVIAVMGLAFSDGEVRQSVKKVVVPSTVKTMWENAFADCRNLTDIYFLGNSIYTDIHAFPDPAHRNGTLTIHCSQNCSDRNMRYYKNSATYYGAVYEEYSGG